MPRANYIPKMDWEIGIGDAANPLNTLTHKNRHAKPPIRFREAQAPMTDGERDRLLSRHCHKRGKRHEFMVRTRGGVKCLWCGLLHAEMN